MNVDTYSLKQIFFHSRIHSFMDKGASSLEDKERMWNFLKYFYLAIWFYDGRSNAKSYDSIILNYIKERKLYQVMPKFWLAFFSAKLKHRENDGYEWEYKPNEIDYNISTLEQCEELLVLTQMIPNCDRGTIKKDVVVTLHDKVKRLLIATDFDVEQDSPQEMLYALQFLTNCTFDEEFNKLYKKFSVKGNDIEFLLNSLIKRKDELTDNEKMILGEFPYNYQRYILKDSNLLLVKR